METIHLQKTNYTTYEETELGILVAVNSENQKIIKKFWKTKDKSKVEHSEVKGFPFIHTDEQDSLKIDFTEEKLYTIENLKKFN